MSPTRRATQYGLGYLIGFFGTLILEVALLVGVESLLKRAVGMGGVGLLVIPAVVGLPVARWLGPLDWAALLAGNRRSTQPTKPKPKRPWDFKLVGVLALFWFLSLLAVIVLFGPFGLNDNPPPEIRFLKIVVATVVICGIGAFLLRKEILKLMSGSPK